MTEQNFTKGKIFGPLMRFTGPVILALLLQTMYGAIDLMIVGKFATSADVSGVSTGSQIMMTFASVAASFSTGATIQRSSAQADGLFANIYTYTERTRWFEQRLLIR